MFVRFVIHQKDPDSGRRQGLFQAIDLLERSDELRADERVRLEEARAWFRANLAVPDRFARSSKSHAHKAAIGWFRHDATEHIAKMRVIADLLAAHGYLVEMIRTDRPGYIVYEDEYQIAAEPFGDTPT